MLDDHHFVSINVFGPHPMSKGSYLSWDGTWVNVKANVEPDAIQAVNVRLSAPADITMTLEKLGLFDGQEPNDNLKRFWQEFKTQLQSAQP